MAKGKKTGGRKTKLTPEVQERIVSAIRAGNYANVAAEYAGIGETTFYRWLQEGREAESGIYRDFREAVKTAEREAEVRAVAMVQKAMPYNWTAAMTYLERKHPGRWGRRDRVTMEMITRDQATDWFRQFGETVAAVVESECGDAAPAVIRMIEARWMAISSGEDGAPERRQIEG